MMHCGFIQKVLLPQCYIIYVTCAVAALAFVPVRTYVSVKSPSCYIYHMFIIEDIEMLVFMACEVQLLRKLEHLVAVKFSLVTSLESLGRQMCCPYPPPPQPPRHSTCMHVCCVCMYVHVCSSKCVQMYISLTFLPYKLAGVEFERMPRELLASQKYFAVSVYIVDGMV